MLSPHFCRLNLHILHQPHLHLWRVDRTAVSSCAGGGSTCGRARTGPARRRNAWRHDFCRGWGSICFQWIDLTEHLQEARMFMDFYVFFFKGVAAKMSRNPMMQWHLEKKSMRNMMNNVKSIDLWRHFFGEENWWEPFGQSSSRTAFSARSVCIKGFIGLTVELIVFVQVPQLVCLL